MNRTTTTKLATLLTLVSLAGTAFAQPCATQSKLLGSAPTSGDNFGCGVSMSFGGPNNVPLLAVGKPNEDAPGAGVDAGGWSVWQFTNGNWNMAYDAWNSTGQLGEFAGASIGLSDPYMIVGAPGFNGIGRARILQRTPGSNSWSVVGNCYPGIVPGSSFSEFGAAVAISSFMGDWAIVGAPRFSETYTNSGAVSIYKRNVSTNQWGNVFTMSGGDAGGQVNGFRGISVAMSKTSPWLAFGALGESSSSQTPENGVVYVMRHDDLSVNPAYQRVTAPIPETNSSFGTSIAIEGTWMVVGAPYEDATLQETGGQVSLVNNGAVYIYKLVNDATWVYTATVRAPNPANDTHFGSTLAMTDSQFVVSEDGTGRVYVYNRVGEEWKLQSTFRDPDTAAGGSYGNALAIYNGQIAIADKRDDHSNAIDPGAVYTMTVAPTFMSGDLCSDPIPMPTTDYVGCTTNATPSVGNVTTCGLGGSGQGNDVWFRFSPTCDGNAIIDTLGSDFDTVLSVHNSCPEASGGHSIMCNDDAGFAAPNNRCSLVTFNFAGGENYLIRVAGYNAGNGQYTLRSNLYYGVSNDNCGTAPTVAAGTYTFNTCSATDSPSAGVPLGSSRDVWYRFIAPTTASYSFDTCGSSFNTVVTLFNGTQQTCPSSAAQMIAQNDDSVGFCTAGTSQQSRTIAPLSQGQSVMVRVGGNSASQFGPGTLAIATVGMLCPADFNLDGVLSPQDIFDFLSAWFAGDPRADFNGGGPSVQDIFDYLGAWFAGC